MLCGSSQGQKCQRNRSFALFPSHVRKHSCCTLSLAMRYASNDQNELVSFAPSPWKFQQGQGIRRMFAVEVGQPEETATRKRVSSAAMCITASPPTGREHSEPHNRDVQGSICCLELVAYRGRVLPCQACSRPPLGERQESTRQPACLRHAGPSTAGCCCAGSATRYRPRAPPSLRQAFVGRTCGKSEPEIMETQFASQQDHTPSSQRSVSQL